MIDDTLKKIEAHIQGAETISPERRAELTRLLGDLKAEVAGLSRTHGEAAQNIAALTEASTQEATREKQDEERLGNSLGSLGSAVEQFEQSHPRLVSTVNAISRALSDLGI